MSLVIKEIIVKTTVEQEPRGGEVAVVFTPEMMERLKEEILTELARYEYAEPKRRER